MSEDVLANLKNHVFFHGTSLRAAEQIASAGFQVWRHETEVYGDGEEKYVIASGGNLGIGIYLSCDWRVALLFGNTLLRVTPKVGTRLLDAAAPPDPKVVRYLQREFGRAILGEAPHKVLPKNKQLKLHELVALFRYHYQKTWETPYGKDGRAWTRAREKHATQLGRFRSWLIRYGYHGYGDPGDENGLVIFSGDWLDLAEVVADLPELDKVSGWYERQELFKSLEHVRIHFQKHGSQRATALAQAVANARTA
jgi:hypothetical protein